MLAGEQGDREHARAVGLAELGAADRAQAPQRHADEQDDKGQHKRRGKHRWDITREKVEVACSRKAYKVRLKPKKTAAVQAKPPKRPAKPKAAALPVPKPVAPRAPRVRLKKYLTDPTPLQRDVRELEGYNAKARERGKKELSYGYWAAEGKPAAPAW